jgi:hypothetical protein
LLEKLGEFAKAVELYRAAAAGTTSVPERNYLIGHAAQVEDRQRGDGRQEEG